MYNEFFQTPVEYAKGVGPQKAELLKKELQIFRFQDLLFHFPFRYVDRSRFYKTNEVNPDMPYIQLKGRLSEIRVVGQQRKQRLTAVFSDDKGRIHLTWFQGVRWISQAIKPGIDYVLFGKPGIFNGEIQIVHPELEVVTAENTIKANPLQPVYPGTEKLKAHSIDSKALQKIIHGVLQVLPPAIPEILPQRIIDQYNLLSFKASIIQIHRPETNELLQKATFRLKFNELFFLQLKLLRSRISRQERFAGQVIPSIGKYFNTFYHEKLPFQLTEAQKRVLKEIRKDMGSGKQMNRLLQGDVGSGKTLVALMSMLMVIDNDKQACLMAPTEILASQHFKTLSELTAGLGLEVRLLTGSTKKRERSLLLQDISEGKIHIVVGTHALLEDQVVFRDLGLVVIDEQHRFGVEQRSKLWMKNNTIPHVLVMTATPIPRTLAMAVYGDLDTSVIDELPPGRKAIETVHRYDSSRLRVFQFLRDEIAKGRQIYIVYPLIQESEKMDYKDLMDGYEAISRAFPAPNYQISMVHGKMKPADKDYEMERFVSGKSHIMVATTVIEVGVNVPNASVMVIESAERFGLSQLHQLRGRVGRGAEQSYCILMTDHKLSAESRIRLDTMVRTSDGFEIAETDLRLRGPGDLAGTQQSGVLDLKLSNLAKDGAILQAARDAARDLLEADPGLSQPEHQATLRYYQEKFHDKTNWAVIS